MQKKDIKNRIFFLLFSILIYRIGVHIPIPGINVNQIKNHINKNENIILNMFDAISGGALSRFSIFSLGIMPYISSSILIQILSITIPYFEYLKNEGNNGKLKIIQYTRFLTFLISLIQSLSISLTIHNNNINNIFESNFNFHFTVVLTLLTGAMFVMWLSEQITEYGLGNGPSIIIISGIISGIPSVIYKIINLFNSNIISIYYIILIIFFFILMIYFILFVECLQRKIHVNYARGKFSNKICKYNISYIPIKINISGVIPPIFASSIILFPYTLTNWSNTIKNNNIINIIKLKFYSNKIAYFISYSLLIIFFCFFYTILVFNTKETSKNLKKSGGFLSCVRPGNNTRDFIHKILIRLTIFGSIYVIIVCLIPEILMKIFNIPLYFGGTSILIVVVVIKDLIAQIKTYLISDEYNYTLKDNILKL